MKKKNFMRRAVAALSALAVCAGAAAYDIPAVVSNITTATAISSNTRVRVDINRNDGRSALTLRMLKHGRSRVTRSKSLQESP